MISPIPNIVLRGDCVANKVCARGTERGLLRAIVDIVHDGA